MASRTLDRVLNLATLGALAWGGWFAWQRFKDFQAGASTITEPIADAYVRLTSGPAVEAIGTIVLPSGVKVPVSSVGKIDSNFAFNWGGVRYVLTGRNAAGEFVAVLPQT
jgi:hypothetical protein